MLQFAWIARKRIKHPTGVGGVVRRYPASQYCRGVVKKPMDNVLR